MPDSESYIGQWLARHRRGSKRHLIESEITDRLVTHCGRQMRLIVNGRGMHAFEDHEFCTICSSDGTWTRTTVGGEAGA